MNKEEALRILGFTPGTNPSEKEINKAYHRMALKLHPDKHSENKKEYTEKFQQLQKAYYLLTGKDNDKKSQYSSSFKYYPFYDLSRHSHTSFKYYPRAKNLEQILSNKDLENYLLEAFRERNLDTLKLLFTKILSNKEGKFGDYINKVLKNGRLPLHQAIDLKDTEFVKLLLDNGANPNIQCFDKAPLLVACEGKDHKAMELLLEHGANPNIQYLGKAPLLVACEGKDHKAMELLLKHVANPNIQCFDKAPLLVACEGKDHKAMELLLEHGANPNIQCFGKAPLLVACEGKDHKAMELLLKHGADLKIKNHSGETLLLIAYRKKDYDSMKLLLEHKANPNTMYDLERTLLLKAFEDQDHQAIELLLNNGANSNAKDKEDKTSLHYLCESRDGNNENSVKIATLLLRKGASPDLKDNRGNKPIDYISNSNSEIGKFMGAKDYYKIIMNASSGTMCLLGSTLFVSYTIFTSNKIVKVSAAFISIGFCVAVAYSAYHATSELLKKPSPEFIEARAEFLNSKQQQQKV